MRILINARFSPETLFNLWLAKLELCRLERIACGLEAILKLLKFVNPVALALNFGNVIWQLHGLATLSSSAIVFWIRVLTLCFSLWTLVWSMKCFNQLAEDTGKREKSGDSSLRHKAEFLLWLLLPREGREAAIGDTNEQFETVLERFGLRRARFWYWGEVARSVWPLISYLGERLLKWTLLGSAIDWVRRHI